MSEYMEIGLFRKDEDQIAQDTDNQEKARQQLADLLGMDVITMDNFSPWDWEFEKNNKIIAIGEYRRRFNDLDKYPDFQFSKHKFDNMWGASVFQKTPAFMFVEFDDGFYYFRIEGTPTVQIMQRNGEMRTEAVVVIPKETFKLTKKLKNEFKEILL